MTLRRQVILGLVVIFLVVVVSNGLVLRAQRSAAIRQIDDRIENIVSGEIRRAPASGAATLAGIYIASYTDEAGLTTVAAPVDLADMVPILPDDFQTREEPFTVATSGTDSSTSLRVGVSRANSTLRVVGFTLDAVEATTTALLRSMAVATAAIGAMLLLVGVAVIRLGVRPLRVMTDAATDLAGGIDDTELPAFPPGSEAQRLGTALAALVEQKNRALEQTRQFIADASHELRTPLTTIVGYASLHEERQLDSGAAMQDALDRIGQEGYRMQRIVDGLIQLAILDERTTLDITTFDLRALVDSVVSDFAITTTTHTFRTAGDAGRLTLTSDRDRVHQVLVAVTNNAAQHTPPGTTVTLTAAQHAASAVITVSDDGPGIEAHHLDRLFNRFYRVHRDSGSDGRSGGLGLSIVRAIVTLLDGTISVDSTVTIGTTFRIEIPLDQRSA